MSRKLIKLTVRLNLENDADRRAYEYLRQLDKTGFKSINQMVIVAINEYFERQERLAADPFLESREKEDVFLQKILDAIAKGMQENVSLGALGGLTRLLQENTTSHPAMPEVESNEKEASDQAAIDFLSNFGT